jgi:hypothetical protein
MRSDYQGNGRHLRIRTGMRMISKGIADALPKDTAGLLSSVAGIAQDSGSVEVVTQQDNPSRKRHFGSPNSSPQDNHLQRRSFHPQNSSGQPGCELIYISCFVKRVTVSVMVMGLLALESW